MKGKSKKPINKFLYWLPRILSILFIAFISIFALDIFDMNLGFWGTIVGLFMHLLPSLILIGALWIAWRQEIVGGILFFFFGVFYVFQTIGTHRTWSLIIAGPAFLVAILFFVNWILKGKDKKFRMVVSIAIMLLLIVLGYSFNRFFVEPNMCKSFHEDVESQLEQANHCEQDSDCDVIMLGGKYVEFGCHHYINMNENKTLFYEQMDVYNERCSKIIDKCAPSPTPYCVNGKCVSLTET